MTMAQRVWSLLMRGARLAVLVTALIVTGKDAGAQTENPIIAKTIADWQKRYDRMKSVRYVVKGTHRIPRGTVPDKYGRPMSPEMPATDVECSVRRVYLIDFVNNRIKIEIDEEVFSCAHLAVVRQKSIAVSNRLERKGTQEQIPRNPDFPGTVPEADASIVTGDLKFAPITAIHWPILFAHGIVRFTSGPEIFPNELRQEYDPGLLVVHGISVEEDVTCSVLRSRTLKGGNVAFSELAIDARRDSAVVRYLQSSNGKPFSLTSIQYRQCSFGWIPASWTFSAFDSGKLGFFEDLRVTEFEPNPAMSDSDFQIELKPGMLVKKRFRSTPSNALGPPSADLVEAFRVNDNGALDSVTFSGGKETRTNQLTKWFIVSLFGILALCVLWLMCRRKSSVPVPS